MGGFPPAGIHLDLFFGGTTLAVHYYRLDCWPIYPEMLHLFRSRVHASPRNATRKYKIGAESARTFDQTPYCGSVVSLDTTESDSLNSTRLLEDCICTHKGPKNWLLLGEY